MDTLSTKYFNNLVKKQLESDKTRVMEIIMSIKIAPRVIADLVVSYYTEDPRIIDLTDRYHEFTFESQPNTLLKIGVGKYFDRHQDTKNLDIISFLNINIIDVRCSVWDFEMFATLLLLPWVDDQGGEIEMPRNVEKIELGILAARNYLYNLLNDRPAVGGAD